MSDRPDYDDAGYEFTLPCGVTVSGLFMCNGEPCELDSLEGVDGWLYIETAEDLTEVVKCTDAASFIEWLKSKRDDLPRFKSDDPDEMIEQLYGNSDW